MAREVFFQRNVTVPAQTQISEQGQPFQVEAVINYDETRFGIAATEVSPWTISIHDMENARDLGRLVGFEGEGQMINSMHALKPDEAAKRGCEITVFRMGEALIMSQLDAVILSAFERWLLKRGWRGNMVKRMKFTDEKMVVPIRTFWVRNGYELILAEEQKWDEHVVKRWR